MICRCNRNGTGRLELGLVAGIGTEVSCLVTPLNTSDKRLTESHDWKQLVHEIVHLSEFGFTTVCLDNGNIVGGGFMAVASTTAMLV